MFMFTIPSIDPLIIISMSAFLFLSSPSLCRPLFRSELRKSPPSFNGSNIEDDSNYNSDSSIKKSDSSSSDDPYGSHGRGPWQQRP